MRHRGKGIVEIGPIPSIFLGLFQPLKAQAKPAESRARVQKAGSLLREGPRERFLNILRSRLRWKVGQYPIDFSPPPCDADSTAARGTG